MQKAALYASGFIFATGATFHFLRLVTGFEIMVAGYFLPTWVSVPSILVSIILARATVTAARRA